MQHWVLDSIGDQRDRALSVAKRVLSFQGMGRQIQDAETDLLLNTSETLELAILDLETEPDGVGMAREVASDAYTMLRAVPLPDDPLTAGHHLLRASVLAVLGGRDNEAALWFDGLEDAGEWPELPTQSSNWGVRCRAVITEVWLRSICQRGRGVHEWVQQRVDGLRNQQAAFEGAYLQSMPPREAKRSALELIGIYFLATAAEVFAQNKEHRRNADVAAPSPTLQFHIDRAISALGAGGHVGMETTARLLSLVTENLLQKGQIT